MNRYYQYLPVTFAVRQSVWNCLMTHVVVHPEEHIARALYSTKSVYGERQFLSMLQLIHSASGICIEGANYIRKQCILHCVTVYS